MKFPTWINSVRATLAVLAMVLIFVIVIGDMFGHRLSGEVLAFVGSSIVGVIMAYYSKGRDSSETGQITSTTQSTTKTEVNPQTPTV